MSQLAELAETSCIRMAHLTRIPYPQLLEYPLTKLLTLIHRIEQELNHGAEIG
jgi:hypothetical protein